MGNDVFHPAELQEALPRLRSNDSSLTTLSLRNISLGDRGAAALSEALKLNSVLTSLNLSCNSLNGAGGEAISEAIKVNSTLTSLNLSWNPLKERGGMAIAEVLQSNSSLTELSVCYCRVPCSISSFIDSTMYPRRCHFLVRSGRAPSHPFPKRCFVHSKSLATRSRPFFSSESTQIVRGTYYGEAVAVKHILRGDKRLLEELPTFVELTHPNVIRLFGVIYSSSHFSIVTELMQHCLTTVLSDYSPAWQTRLQYALDISEGLNYMHDRNIVHQHLDADHVLISFPDIKTGRKLAKLRYFSSAQSLERAVASDGNITASTLFAIDIMSLGPILCALSAPISELGFEEGQSQLRQLGELCCQTDPSTPTLTEILRTLKEISVSETSSCSSK